MNKLAITLSVLVLSVGLTVGACAKKEDGAAKGGDPAATAHAEAMTKWDTLCVSCHGKTGVGDGAAAVALDPKPRSFADAEWQKETDDAKIAKVILEGGLSSGLSAGMPPNPDLKSKPEVVDALVKHIRSLKK